MHLLSVKEQFTAAPNMRSKQPLTSFFDHAFDNEMNSLIEQTTAHYEATNFKSALKTGLFDYQNARSWYRDVTGGDMNRDLVLRFIETQALLIAPIAPHWSEYIWREVLKKVHHFETLAEFAEWIHPDSSISYPVMSRR